MGEKWISRLIAFVMAFLLAFAGVSCLVTGFELNVDLGVVAINILVATVLIIVANSFHWGNLILTVVLALFLNHLWYRQDLEQSLEGLLFWISLRFDGAYNWGVIYWSEQPPFAATLEMALSVATLPAIWAIVWTVIHRAPAFLAVPISALLPAMCFVITNSVPAGWCLFLLCLGLLLLMLTQTVRRQSEKDGNRLIAMLLIPSLLCTGLLFWAVPQDGYSPKFDTPQWLQGLFDIEGLGGAGSGGINPGETVDLSQIGPKWQARTEVMQVKSDRKGVIYLRGQAYDVYNGSTWTVSDIDTTKDAYWPTDNMEAQGNVTITRSIAQRLWYLPYYPQDANLLKNISFGRLEGEVTKEYTIPIMDRADVYSLAKPFSRTDPLVQECLKLPSDTAAEAEKIVKNLSIIPSYHEWNKAQIIAEYISTLKPYDINTGSMPKNEKDFALWFINEAETGYCVHFATAAVILLRAANVPARYVTGYMVDVGEGFAIVEERHAHAWVEYLDRNRGWTILDPTPAQDEPLPTNPTEPTDSTEPSESTEPTESTEPSESTDPSEFTEPTQSTDPGESTLPTETIPGQTQTGKPVDFSWLWDFLLYGLLALAAVGLVAGQYFLRIHLRKKKRRNASTNEKALLDWKEVNRLSRLLKQPVSEELEELAEKAKFSQYTLTAAEIGIFRHRITQLKAMLQSKNWLSRFVLKLVFALE